MENNNENNISKKIDMLFLIITTMFFALVIVFSYVGFSQNPTNVFMVFVVRLGTIIGNYTNITAAMIYSIIFVFLYASLHIYLNISRGFPVGGQVYYWMLAVPLFSFVFACYGKMIRDIQQQNISLKKENAEYVMIDKETGLMTSRTFLKELQVFMRIQERYNIEVNLILIKVKYEDQVIRILGQSKYNRIVKEFSKALSSMLREEDKKYILRDANMFGIIMLSNKNGGEHVKERIKKIFDEIDFEDDALINKVRLEVLVGLVRYDREQIRSPYELYKMAEKDLEYDV